MERLVDSDAHRIAAHKAQIDRIRRLNATDVAQAAAKRMHVIFVWGMLCILQSRAGDLCVVQVRRSRLAGNELELNTWDCGLDLANGLVYGALVNLACKKHY